MTIKEIKTTIEQAQALKQIAVAYTEISSNKLKRIRTLVENNRNFLEELALVYKVLKQRALQKKLLPTKNKKTVSVLIGANEHFSGNVNQNVAKFFTDAMKQTQSDQIVIGKTAIEWLESIHYSMHYTRIVLKKGYPESSELDMLVRLVKDYSQIIIYYPKMRTVMLQIPTAEDITQTAYLKTDYSEEEKKKLFIFEPEFTKILDYFESQVTNLLLQQTFLEAELSRTASRLVSMDESQNNADKLTRQNSAFLDQANKSAANNRLLGTYASILLAKRIKENPYEY